MIRKPIFSALTLVAAMMLVTAAAFGAVEVGMVDSEDINPVGTSEAAIGIGTVAVAVVVGAATAHAAHEIHDQFFGPQGINESAMEEADAEETEISIHQQAVTQQESNNLIDTSFGNHLEDTTGPARRAGTNAYIRALNNGSSEAVAQSEAYGAVDDYYAARQDTVLASWEQSAAVVENLRKIAANKTGVSETFVPGHITTSTSASAYYIDTTSLDGFSNPTVTLINGSTETVLGVDFKADWASSVSGGSPTVTGTAKPGSITKVGPEGQTTQTLEKVEVKAPNQNFNKTVLMDLQRFNSTWTAIENQRDTVRSNLDNFISSTFSAYQAGEINATDLIDPYLGAREYSPTGDFGAWSMLMLQNMGLSPPENAGSLGTMAVKDLTTGETINGILMSDGTPQGGFSVGETYDAANLTGLQYVIDEDAQSQHELTGEFKLLNATTKDGETVQDVAYRNVTYASADNVEEFRQTLQELRNATAQVEAWQQDLRDPPDGGVGLFGGLGGFSLGLGMGLDGPQALVALIAGFLALLAATRAVIP